MNTPNWRRVIPVAAAVVILCFTAIYISEKEHKKQQIKRNNLDNDDQNDDDHKIPNTKSEKPSDWIDQINALKEELKRVKKQKIKHAVSSKLQSRFNVNDIIEMHYKGKWRKAVIEEILPAIQVSVCNVNDENILQSVIIDSEEQIFCDCYDICQENRNSIKHMIRFDNKQSEWAKSMKHFFSSSKWI